MVIVTHVVSSRGSGASSDDSWFHSAKRRGWRREGEREDQTFTSEYLCSGSTQISRHIFCGLSERWWVGRLALGDPHTLAYKRA